MNDAWSDQTIAGENGDVSRHNCHWLLPQHLGEIDVPG